ncbi:hypothetical protein HW555_007517 [Spodoptera exigua]|uniref:Uncharacterized protein n=1 Tax=Spodoptera exigua TaxID=7107 RepID=A0A835L2M2_SPOEX|nr:hypothetical protein HW555_007517 [Spodoptera exigua]
MRKLNVGGPFFATNKSAIGRLNDVKSNHFKPPCKERYGNFFGWERDGILLINLPSGSADCFLEKPNYKFVEGQNLTIDLPKTPVINHGWWRLKTPNNETLVIDNSLKNDKNHKTIVNRYMEGTWEFEFYIYQDNRNFLPHVKKVIYPPGTQTVYTPVVCRTDVTVEWSEDTRIDTKFIIICSAVGALAFIIIIGQAIYIFYLKSLARRLHAHNNLSKKAESDQSDRARYCSNPRQKKIKEMEPVESRDSVIYEAPNIQITDSGRKQLLPPNLPAISTMPSTPKIGRNVGMHQPMHGATLNHPSRSPMMDQPPSFPRQTERDMASRPPLPLPPQDNFEVYEQMTEGMDTYEPPPPVTSNAMPPRLPMPPKKVPTANLVNVKEDTLKARRGVRPPVTPKPQMPQTAVAPVNELEQVLKRRQAGIETTTRNNELEEAFRKRNNVKQVPILSIPDPSSAKNRPTVKSKPKIPQPQPVQEEIYYNENQASSDEEWTYEPLKPHKNYDPNIYNI